MYLFIIRILIIIKNKFRNVNYMWRIPNLNDLDVDKETKKLMAKSIYFSRKGVLRDAGNITQIQYSLALIGIWIISSAIVYLSLSFGFGFESFNFITFIPIIVLIGGSLVYFIKWGWYKYEESWYFFDIKNKIFFVTKKVKSNWEIFEIPFETIHVIEWSGEKNGYASIGAGRFTFDTNRMNDKRFSSVTELWENLALIDTKMINWPINLECESCNRKFGHHIGTAMCPFDNIILIDPNIKGRIDPIEMHPDDENRV